MEGARFGGSRFVSGCFPDVSAMFLWRSNMFLVLSVLLDTNCDLEFFSSKINFIIFRFL